MTTLTLDFTQADGAASGWSAASANPVPTVVSNRLQAIDTGIREGTYSLTGTGLSFTGDFKVDFDCWSTTTIGAGGVGVALLTGTFSGYYALASNSTHLYTFTNGTRSAALTNDARSVNQVHVTFERRASDGRTRIYLDGVVNSEIIENTLNYTGFTLMYLYMESNQYPTEVAWVDNLVVSDSLSAPAATFAPPIRLRRFPQLTRR